MKSGVLGREYAEKRKCNKAISFRYKLRALWAVKMITKYVSSNNLKIMDFGCAEGKTLLYMNQMLQNSSFVGLEYSDELIAMAPSMPHNISLHQADILDIPDDLKGQDFDVVTALAFFEHLEDLSGALKNVHKILADKGILVATFPNPIWDSLAVKLCLLKSGDHLSHLDSNSFLGMLKENGFELLEYVKFMWAPVAIIPYFQISVHEKSAYGIDKCLRSVPVINMLMVNQLFVAKKT